MKCCGLFKFWYEWTKLALLFGEHLTNSIQFYNLSYTWVTYSKIWEIFSWQNNFEVKIFDNKYKMLDFQILYKKHYQSG